MADSQRLRELRYLFVNPWIKHMRTARRRCRDPKHEKFKFYGGKGIQFLISVAETKQLWRRDKAIWMKAPQIDRIDSYGHYTFSNCRFLEAEENRRRVWYKKNKRRIMHEVKMKDIYHRTVK